MDISADPKVNALLSGPKNGDRVKWYVTFAKSPLVLGVSASSCFADEAKGKTLERGLVPQEKLAFHHYGLTHRIPDSPRYRPV
jgi:hypothetical protein